MPEIIPTVIDRGPQGAGVAYDLYSRLLKERIVFAGGHGGVVTTEAANILIAQLLYLESEDPGKKISMYINSPGGSVSAGLAIYDCMQHISSPIETICMGMAMSFGAVLLAAGEKGKRFALPHSRIMIHQPLISGGGIDGQATDIMIEAAEMQQHKERLTQILAFHSGQDYGKVKADCERNFYMSSEDAKAYGMIDGIIYPRKGKAPEGPWTGERSGK